MTRRNLLIALGIATSMPRVVFAQLTGYGTGDTFTIVQSKS